MSFLRSGIIDEESQSKIREADFLTPFPRLGFIRSWMGREGLIGPRVSV